MLYYKINNVMLYNSQKYCTYEISNDFSIHVAVVEQSIS